LNYSSWHGADMFEEDEDEHEEENEEENEED
jgi:hypothetical protein